MKKRILVVDDEPRIRRFVRMNLELEGYDVFEAEDGLTTLARVREDMPDLVLLDVMMPHMDGFETLAHIREFSQVPVIILTAKGDEDDLTHGLDLGADDYITKPFQPAGAFQPHSCRPAPGRAYRRTVRGTDGD